MNNTTTSQHKPNRNTGATAPVEKKETNYQLYRWQFTLKTLIEPNEQALGAAHCAMLAREARGICMTLNEIAKEWYMQLEIGENGYIHYQGCLSLNNKEYMQTTKNLLGRDDVHLEKAKNWHALKAYCGKNETRISGPWSHKSVWIKTIEILYPWQQAVVDLINNPCEDDRTIHWFYDTTGCKGKTQLCKYLYVHYGATVLNNGKSNDLAYALPEHPEIVCILLPRSIEGRVNYSAIEAIKDGMILSGKYKSCMKAFNSPHVIVMANFAPDVEALSVDRWHIHNVHNTEAAASSEPIHSLASDAI